ncbi:MAG: hypothetical protein ACHQK8_01855 [Bacteroidia bacterium]
MKRIKLLIFVIFTNNLSFAQTLSTGYESKIQWGSEYKFDASKNKFRELSLNSDSTAICLVEYEMPLGSNEDIDKYQRDLWIHVEVYEKNSLTLTDSFSVNTKVNYRRYLEVKYYFTQNKAFFIISSCKNYSNHDIDCIVSNYKGAILKIESFREEEKPNCRCRLATETATTFSGKQDGLVCTRNNYFMDSTNHVAFLRTDVYEFGNISSGDNFTFRKVIGNAVPLDLSGVQGNSNLYRISHYHDLFSGGANLKLFNLVNNTELNSKGDDSYSSKWKRSSGIEIDEMSTRSNKFIGSQRINFPKALIKEFSGEDNSNEFTPKRTDDGAHLSDRFKFKRIMQRPEGGFVIILEYHHDFCVDCNPPATGSWSSKEHRYLDPVEDTKSGFHKEIPSKKPILWHNSNYFHSIVLSVDVNGNLVNYKLIPKWQGWNVFDSWKYTGEQCASDIFSSESIMEVKNKSVYLIYNDHVKNIDRTKFGDMKVLAAPDKAATYILKVDSNGNYTKKFLLSPESIGKEPRYIFTNLSLKIKESEYVVMAIDTKMKSYRFGRIKLD